jgi:hypothetical protein
MAAIRGSCLCGGVKFEINGPLLRPLHCHCSRCRKQHGAAFRSRVRVRAADVRWLQGEELVTFYESSPGFFRGFCRVCGSPVANRPGPNYPPARADPAIAEELGIPLGILDDDPGIRPDQHIFVADKALWFEITDDVPQYPEMPPPR